MDTHSDGELRILQILNTIQGKCYIKHSHMMTSVHKFRQSKLRISIEDNKNQT